MGSRSPTQRYTPGEDESLSVAIITALSEVKGRDITEDECILYKSIDPEALDGIFRDDEDENTVKVEFTTHDAIVILWGNGDLSIEIQDLEADPSHE